MVKLSKRMTRCDRILYAKKQLEYATQKYEQYKQLSRFGRNIYELCDSGRAQYDSLSNFLSVVLTAEEYDNLITDTNGKFVSMKLKERESNSMSSSCNACFNWQAQLKCLKCGKLKFCYGCTDYNDGMCVQCKEEKLVHNWHRLFDRIQIKDTLTFER